MEKECPVCGKSAARAYRPGISRCGGCGLAWLDEKRFGEPEYAAGALEDIYVSAKRELFARALKTLEKPAPGKGELLDLGSAYGDLLAAAEKEGWQAEGVEISPGPASAALKKGFMVYTRPVEELGLPENFYDVATAFEVFSQMSDPPKAAAELYRILKPGGVIYIREFNGAFHMALEGRRIFEVLGLRPSVVHNFNFTAESLRRMLRSAGFNDIRTNNSRPTSGDPYGTGGRLGGSFTGLFKFLYYLFSEAVYYASFGKFLTGSSFIVTARK